MPGKDKQPPVIVSVSPNDGFTISSLNTRMPVKATATDDVGVFQIIFQVDPIGVTYPAPDPRNKAFWQAVDFYKDSVEFAAHIDGLNIGQHTLRVTVYDRERNPATKEVKFSIE